MKCNKDIPRKMCNNFGALTDKKYLEVAQRQFRSDVEVFYKKVVLKTLSKYTSKNQRWNLFNKVIGLQHTTLTLII